MRLSPTRFKYIDDFSDNGEHEGDSGTTAVPCWLIQQDKDWMLLDTGPGDLVLILAYGNL